MLEVEILTVKSQALERKKDILSSIRALEEAFMLIEGHSAVLEIDLLINLGFLYSKMGNRFRAVDMYLVFIYFWYFLEWRRYKRLFRMLPEVSQRESLLPAFYKKAGEELLMLGKTKQSIVMNKRAFVIYKARGDYSGQVHSVSSILLFIQIHLILRS